jgi:hypothetical protein
MTRGKRHHLVVQHAIDEGDDVAARARSSPETVGEAARASREGAEPAGSRASGFSRPSWPGEILTRSM